MHYRRLIIYYMTGTGNALAVARWFAAEARSRGMTAELVNTDRFTRPIAAPAGADVITGFFYPTHGFTLAWHMFKFFFFFPRGRRAVFCGNTFGGTKVGPLPIPGLSGLALVLPALILLCKGCRLRGLMSYNLPVNWLALHPAIRPRAAAFLADFNQRRVARDAAQLFAGRAVWRGLISLPFDLAVSPVALGYFLVGRFWLAKMYIASAACNACALCERLCPVGAITMKGGRPFWSLRCESCMRCMNICPCAAIQVSHLFTILSAWLLYGILFPLAVGFAARHVAGCGILTHPESMLIGLLRAWIILGIMFLAYRLVQFLARRKTFNIVFAGLTLTRLPFWRRYLAPGVRTADFHAGEKKQ